MSTALACLERPAQGGAAVFSIHTESQALTTRLHAGEIPFALAGSGERILQCGRASGFTLEAAPTEFAGGTVRIRRLSKAAPETEDVLMLDVLVVSPEIEGAITTETHDWEGTVLRTVDRASLIRLKKSRGSTQDIAGMEKLA